MIIRDLEHYEVDSKVIPIQKVEGGFFPFFSTVNISVININNGDGDFFSMTQINFTNQITAPIIVTPSTPSTPSNSSNRSSPCSCNEGSQINPWLRRIYDLITR